jgi:hypothetical protein
MERLYAIRRNRDGWYYKGTRRRKGAVGIETEEGIEYEAEYIFTREIGYADLFCAVQLDGRKIMAQEMEVESQKGQTPSTFSVVEALVDYEPDDPDGVLGVSRPQPGFTCGINIPSSRLAEQVKKDTA